MAKRNAIREQHPDLKALMTRPAEQEDAKGLKALAVKDGLR
jgi:hypothetical protein